MAVRSLIWVSLSKRLARITSRWTEDRWSCAAGDQDVADEQSRNISWSFRSGVSSGACRAGWSYGLRPCRVDVEPAFEDVAGEVAFGQMPTILSARLTSMAPIRFTCMCSSASRIVCSGRTTTMSAFVVEDVSRFS